MFKRLCMKTLNLCTSNFKKLRHGIYRCTYHIVWTLKYRVEHLIKSLKADDKKFEYKICQDVPGGHSFNRTDTKIAQEIRVEIYMFLSNQLNPPDPISSVKELRKAAYRF